MNAATFRQCGSHMCLMCSPPEELLVVGELDDERHLEGVLQPLGEHEGDEMAQVQGFAGGASACGSEVAVRCMQCRHMGHGIWRSSML